MWRDTHSHARASTHTEHARDMKSIMSATKTFITTPASSRARHQAKLWVGTCTNLWLRVSHWLRASRAAPCLHVHLCVCARVSL